MSKILVITGRGGTGKTTLAALAARFLPSRKLLVDADPDESLAAMLGADLAASGSKSVSEILYDIQGGKTPEELVAMPLPDKIQYLLHFSCLYEGNGFDLVTLGTKWTRGCYCAPNDVLRALVPQLAGNYDFTIIDSPAGIEHLNRQLVSQVDDILAVVDSSAKSVRNTECIRDLASAIAFRYENLYVVANYRCGAEDEERFRSIRGARFIGRIEKDEQVARFDTQGRSLLELPEDSPACRSARRVLEKAGYLTSTPTVSHISRTSDPKTSQGGACSHNETCNQR